MQKKIVHIIHHEIFSLVDFSLGVKLGMMYLLLMFPFFTNGQDTLQLSIVEKTNTEMVDDLLLKADTTSSSPIVLQYLLQAQNFLEKEKSPRSLFDIYTRIGKIYQSENLHERALPFYRKANLLPTPPITTQQKMDLLEPIAKAYFELGKTDSALMAYATQLDYYKTNNDYAGRLKVLQRKVDVFLKIGSYAQALKYNKQIKYLAEEKADKTHLAIIYNNIGYNLNQLEDYKEAIKYFLAAKTLREKGYSTLSETNYNSNKTSPIDLTMLYTNLGIAHNNIDDPKNAIKYLVEAKKTNDADSTALSDAYLDHLIATIHLNHGNVYDAFKSNESAITASKENKDLRLLSSTYLTAAKIQQKLYDYELALSFYQKHFALRDSFELENRLRRQQLLQQQLLLEKSEKEIRLLLINEEIKDQQIAALQFQQQLLESDAARIKLNSEKLELEKQQQEKDLLILKSEQEKQAANLRSSELEKQKARQDLVLIKQRLIAEQKDKEAKAAKNKEMMAQMESENAKAAQKEAEQAAQLAKQSQEFVELQLEQEEAFRQFVYGLGALLALVFIMILSGLYYSRIANRRLEAKNREIEEERRKSEKLLLNILPQETANELKTTGIATPKEYDKVSVLFADFSNFTKISENLSPEQLLIELNECFRAFDEITARHGLEKIKTIGDGYMCAGGIPIANETNPTDAVKAAIEMQNYMQGRYQEKTGTGDAYWNMRVGIHTGHVIAGVVGTKKFAYDIWGDTVNIASRMESACENGKINISSKTRGLINGEFDCTYRGEVEVKHAIKVGMYFVKSS
ncbi:MAG: adenylate/guanylate cyclase domain-containing protein [Bacteroidota bacterium]